MRKYWRVGLTIAVIASFVAALVPGSDISEIHNSEQPSNFILADPRPASDDWPWFRGTDGWNVANSDQFPTQWTPGDHEGWQVATVGDVCAMPCLWGNQVFLLSAESAARRNSIICLNRSDGRVAWQTQLHPGMARKSAERSRQNSVTLACDGQSVYAAANFAGKLWLSAVGIDGKIVWQHEAGPFHSVGRYHSSPVLYKSLVIVVADRDSGSYIAALHRQTGEVIWRIKRHNGESYGTPVVATVAGRPQLILGGKGSIDSYDPATGEQLWTCRTTASRFSNSIAFDEEHVYATSTKPKDEVVCINADGRGDVTSTHFVWRLPKIAGEITSPVCHGKLLYVLAEDGRLSCVRTETGTVEWVKKLDGEFSASPIIAGSYLLCASRTGTVYFVQTGVPSTVTIENKLSGGIASSPIVAGSSIFIQTANHFHRIDQASTGSIVEQPTPHKRRL